MWRKPVVAALWQHLGTVAKIFKAGELVSNLAVHPDNAGSDQILLLTIW